MNTEKIELINYIKNYLNNKLTHEEKHIMRELMDNNFEIICNFPQENQKLFLERFIRDSAFSCFNQRLMLKKEILQNKNLAECTFEFFLEHNFRKPFGSLDLLELIDFINYNLDSNFKGNYFHSEKHILYPDDIEYKNMLKAYKISVVPRLEEAVLNKKMLQKNMSMDWEDEIIAETEGAVACIAYLALVSEYTPMGILISKIEEYKAQFGISELAVDKLRECVRNNKFNEKQLEKIKEILPPSGETQLETYLNQAHYTPRKTNNPIKIRKLKKFVFDKMSIVKDFIMCL